MNEEKGIGQFYKVYHCGSPAKGTRDSMIYRNFL